MFRNSVMSFIIGVLAFVLTMTPEIQAEQNPIADSRSASSDKTEPIVTVGPSGETLLTNEETTKIGPGMELTTFERFDARGWLNGEVMTIDLINEEVSTDLLYPGVITDAKPVSELATEQGAVAGVNGDFFDINRTNAPIGTMIQDGELLKGPQGSHNLTFGINQDDFGRISRTFLEGSIQLPSGNVNLAALNQSSIPAGGIGLYNPVWGQAQRPSANHAYEVTVSNGVVVSTSNEVGSGQIDENSYVLVGRDAGADTLRELNVGDEVSVSYAPTFENEEFMDFAIGGNAILVEQGEVKSGLDNRTTAPRSAVGLSKDGTKMFLVVVDGRQKNSRGMTLHELGKLLEEFGAYQALNIDGGGSSTMVARMPGESNVEVVNNPSDGSERPVPNGIGIFVNEGSGELKNFGVETVMEEEYSHRIFPGLSRDFSAKGYDENFSPVSVESVEWQTLPADVGTFDENGIFTAKKTGEAVVQAQVKSSKGFMDITVLGELDRIEASTSYLSLEMDQQESFIVKGNDKNGFSAPIESRDVSLEYDSSVIHIEEREDGSFEVVPLQDGGATTIEITVQEQVFNLPVTIGLETVNISHFESKEGWGATKYPSSVEASMELVDGKVGKGVKLNYNFSTTTATRAAYLQASPMLELPGDVQQLGLWVKGDGNGAWLRTVLEDASGTRYTLTLADEVNWTDWQFVETTLPDGIQYPVKLWRIYPVEINPDDQYTGSLIFDDLSVKIPPNLDEVEEGDSTTDPLIAQNESLSKDRWRFAVLNDSQFVAASPNSQQVQMARKALRQIVEQDPEFLVINGDLVDTAWKEDFEFAKQVLEEEIGDAFPIYYTPGNHEIAGSGSLVNFLDVFDKNRYTFDHEGTRFILLDSSKGSFRTSDYEQLIELKESLNEAATNPNIKNVVVFGHHPTRDPLPTNNSQLSDPNEAKLIENWLTEFRDTSQGKGAIYVSGHAHTVNLERVEGVPYMVTGSAGKAPYGSPENGGFYAWTMFGVDPTPSPEKGFEPGHIQSPRGSQWIKAEVQPILEDITVNGPQSLEVGETVNITAQGHQAGNLSFPLRYPASVTWQSSENVFVGTGEELIEAKKSNDYDAIFDFANGELTAINPGAIQLKVISNNKEAIINIELK